MKINIKKLKLWITALRSGEYRQTKATLQDENGYCCLGVACKLFIPEDKQKLNADGYLVGSMPDEQLHVPKWLKGISNDFFIKTEKCLSGLNDIDGLSFNEIADLLEQTYLTPNTEENEK
jgi:hypothetical protein